MQVHKNAQKRAEFAQTYAKTLARRHTPNLDPNVGFLPKDARAINEHPQHWGSNVTEQVVSASVDTPVVFSMQIKALKPVVVREGPSVCVCVCFKSL